MESVLEPPSNYHSKLPLAFEHRQTGRQSQNDTQLVRQLGSSGKQDQKKLKRKKSDRNKLCNI